MMKQIVFNYVTCGIIFGALDFLWLSNAAPRLYRPELGNMLADEFRMAPALIFYALYLLGMQIFAIAPAMKSGQWTTALIYGALFGFFCYATYDLTSQAVLRQWSTKVTIIDIVWGTFATGTAAAISAAITLRLFPLPAAAS